MPRNDPSKYDRPERPLVPLPDHPPFTARFLNLDYGVTEENLASLFDSEFRIVEVKVPLDIETNRSRGFAFVEFEDRTSLERATSMDGQNFLGRTLRVLVAEQRRERNGFQRRDADYGNERDFDNWERRGPLPPSNRPEFRDREAGNRNYSNGFRSSDLSAPEEDQRDYESGFRSAPREPVPEDNRDYNHWEHRGPLPPLEDKPKFGNRGPRRSSNESHPRFREPTDQEKRIESVNDWRSTGPKSPAVPRSPERAKPAGRVKLNLAPRSMPLGTSTQVNRSSSLFGAAKPVDTAKKFQEIEERQAKIHQEYLAREQKRAEAAKQKKEAREKLEATRTSFASLSTEDDASEEATKIIARKEDESTEMEKMSSPLFLRRN